MASGDHRSITLKKGDAVVISSTPIPGNEKRYAQIGDDLARMDVTQYRHPTHEIDGSGPLHVSGHGSRDEHKEMIALTRPKFLMPIYGGALPRRYHQGIGLAAGIAEQNIVMVENGTFTELGSEQITSRGAVASGALLVDQTGAVVPEIVTKDRLLLMEDGFVVIAITVNKNGRLLTSPDILTRGHVAVKESVDLMNGLRTILKKTVAKRTKLTSRTAIDLLKNELRIEVVNYIYAQTLLTPIVIPVVNIIGPRGETNLLPRPVADVH